MTHKLAIDFLVERIKDSLKHIDNPMSRRELNEILTKTNLELLIEDYEMYKKYYDEHYEDPYQGN